MNYDELRESIKTWSSNNGSEFLEQIDTFIRSTESSIYSSVRLPKFSATVSLTMTANDPLTELPADFLSVDSIAPTGQKPLLMKDTDFILEAYPDPTVKGLPRFFGMNDDRTVRWGPIPDQSYPFFLQYFNKPASIVEERNGTYVSDRWPTALLHGALMFACIFMKDTEGKQENEEIFLSSLGLSSAFVKGRASKQTFEKNSSAVEATELK